MNRQTPEFDQRIADWLEVDPSIAPPDVMATVRAALPSISQARRGLFAPGRFRDMPALSRATGIAAVALVAVVGAGGIIYLNSNDVGSQNTSAPTAEPTVAPTPGPSEVAPGILAWKTYTSAVYGYTISYPDDWSIADRATERWQPGAPDDGSWHDSFVNDEATDGDGIAFFALQFPAPTGADLASWDGLLAALTEMCADPAEFFYDGCPSENQVTPMCLGSAGCRPVAIVHDTDEQPRAAFGDPETGLVMYIHVGRNDNFPAAGRYDGTVTLLKSILSQMGVREPEPGETAP